MKRKENRNGDASSASRTRKPFRVHWITLVILGCFYGGVLAMIAVRGGEESAERLADAVTNAAKMVLFSVLVAWIVYRVARRSWLAGNIALVAMTVLYAWLIFTAVARIVANPVAITTERREQMQELAHAIILSDLEENTQGRMDAMDGLAAVFDDAVAASHGDERRMLEFSRSFIKGAMALRARVDRVSEEWLALGGADFTMIQSADDMRERREVMESLAYLSAELRDYHAPEHVREALVREGFGQEVLAGYMRGYQNERQQIQYAILEQECIAIDSLLGNTRLLEETYGSWEYDEEHDQVNFDESLGDAPIEAFNANWARFDEAIQQQERLMQELAALLAPPPSPASEAAPSPR